jgi:hypothetical protein
MYAMANGLRLALFLCVGSVLLPVASAAQADDQSLPRSVSVCTPNRVAAGLHVTDQSQWPRACARLACIKSAAASLPHQPFRRPGRRLPHEPRLVGDSARPRRAWADGGVGTGCEHGEQARAGVAHRSHYAPSRVERDDHAGRWTRRATRELAANTRHSASLVYRSVRDIFGEGRYRDIGAQLRRPHFGQHLLTAAKADAARRIGPPCV